MSPYSTPSREEQGQEQEQGAEAASKQWWDDGALDPEVDLAP